MFGYCVHLSEIWILASFLYNWYDWMLRNPFLLLECMCFTVISTLNLVQSATGTTDQAGCTSRDYTDTYDWSLVVLFLWLHGAVISNFDYLSVFLNGCYDWLCGS